MKSISEMNVFDIIFYYCIFNIFKIIIEHISEWWGDREYRRWVQKRDKYGWSNVRFEDTKFSKECDKKLYSNKLIKKYNYTVKDLWG